LAGKPVEKIELLKNKQDTFLDVSKSKFLSRRITTSFKYLSSVLKKNNHFLSFGNKLNEVAVRFQDLMVV
jgi:hypothetical protein